VLAGASQIVAIDLSDEKLGLARQLGATHTVNAKDADHVKQVRDLTNGGVDYAFDLAGAIKSMETAYLVTRWGGTTVSAGLSPLGANFSFVQSVLVSEEKTIKGSYMGSCVPVRDIPRFIALYQQGKLPVDRMVSQHVGFDELNEGFDRLQDVATVRQILVLHDVLGLTFQEPPKFARRYANVSEVISQAVREYCADVQSGSFPSDAESYHSPAELRERLPAPQRP